MYIYKHTCNKHFFPTCQVRVVRFYQSCSSPPLPPSSSSSASSSSSTTSASTSTSTVALPTLGQALRQLRGSVRTYCWTSTWGLPSSVRTAGPQPGAFRVQCAPLDLKSQIECQKICQIECQIECEKICQIKCHKICQMICQIEC